MNSRRRMCIAMRPAVRIMQGRDGITKRRAALRDISPA
jgi:hypothetical protein